MQLNPRFTLLNPCPKHIHSCNPFRPEIIILNLNLLIFSKNMRLAKQFTTNQWISNSANSLLLLLIYHHLCALYLFPACSHYTWVLDKLTLAPDSISLSFIHYLFKLTPQLEAKTLLNVCPSISLTCGYHWQLYN